MSKKLEKQLKDAYKTIVELKAEIKELKRNMKNSDPYDEDTNVDNVDVFTPEEMEQFRKRRESVDRLKYEMKIAKKREDLKRAELAEMLNKHSSKLSEDEIEIMKDIIKEGPMSMVDNVERALNEIRRDEVDMARWTQLNNGLGSILAMALTKQFGPKQAVSNFNRIIPLSSYGRSRFGDEW